MENKLLVPDIGDFEQVEIIEVLVKKGDKIKKKRFYCYLRKRQI